MKRSTVVLVGGLPGTGKTYFAKRFALAMGANYVSTDLLRKEMFPERNYTAAEKEKVYEEMLARMRKALANKEDIVVDGTFYKEELRDRFIFTAETFRVDPVFIITSASESTIRERLGRPREDSEANYEVYRKLKPQFEPLQQPYLLLHTDWQTVEESIEMALDYVKEHSAA